MKIGTFHVPSRLWDGVVPEPGPGSLPESGVVPDHGHQTNITTPETSSFRTLTGESRPESLRWDQWTRPLT